jgi:IS4 transposase
MTVQSRNKWGVIWRHLGYKNRWRIETGFRIQDEARIMSKSIDARIRFFFFAYEQVLQLIWIVLYKEEVTFKEFLLDIYEFCALRNSKSGKLL